MLGPRKLACLQVIVVVFATFALSNAEENYFDQEANDKNGVKQFHITSQLKKTTVEIPNLERDKTKTDVTKHINLKFTLNGTHVKSQNINGKDTGIWGFVLSDGSTVQISTKTVTVDKRTIEQYSFNWDVPKEEELRPEMREVCFLLNNKNKWYSTYQGLNQNWPMDLTRKVDTIPFNAIQSTTTAELLYVVEHLFLSSSGYAIILDRESPLWYRIDPNNNDPLMCITSQPKAPYGDNANADVKFSLYAGKNLKDIYMAVTSKLHDNSPGGEIVPPKHIPEEHVFAYPSWLLTAGKSDKFDTVNSFYQKKIEEFVNDLKGHDYKHGLIVFDSWWQRKEPYLEFDSNIINDPKALVQHIRKDHNISLTIAPLVSIYSGEYTGNESYFVKDKNKKTKTVSNMALVDFSYSKASKWFIEKLNYVKDHFNLDSFTFEPLKIYDADDYIFHEKHAQANPLYFAQEYVNVAKKFGPLATVCEGHHTQDLSAFVRMSPRTPDWAGLKTLIPTALALSMAGYSFFIPDVIGAPLSQKMSDKLYQRWVQATTYMPAMQFVTPPWDYKPDIQRVVKKFVDLHTANASLFTNLARERVDSGFPIIRPMWWADPDNEKLYTIDHQFLVGDNLLIAPVLEEDDEKRTVYLPHGNWKYLVDGSTHQGNREIVVNAPVSELPRFIRV